MPNGQLDLSKHPSRAAMHGSSREENIDDMDADDESEDEKDEGKILCDICERWKGINNDSALEMGTDLAKKRTKLLWIWRYQMKQLKPMTLFYVQLPSWLYS